MGTLIIGLRLLEPYNIGRGHAQRGNVRMYECTNEERERRLGDQGDRKTECRSEEDTMALYLPTPFIVYTDTAVYILHDSTRKTSVEERLLFP